MKRFKNILLYAGGEVSPQPALDRGVALAQKNEARLTLVDVLPEEAAGPWMTLPGRADLERMLVVARREELEELAAPFHIADQEVVVTASVGIVLASDVYQQPEDRLRAHYLLTRYGAREKDEVDPLAAPEKPAKKKARRKKRKAATK